MKKVQKLVMLSSLLLTFSCSIQSNSSSNGDSFSIKENSNTSKESNSVSEDESSSNNEESSTSFGSEETSVSSSEQENNSSSFESVSSSNVVTTEENESSKTNSSLTSSEVEHTTSSSSTISSSSQLSSSSSVEISSEEISSDDKFDINTFVMPEGYIGSYFGKLIDYDGNNYSFNNKSELSIIINNSKIITINSLQAEITNYDEMYGFSLKINGLNYNLLGKEENEIMTSLSFSDEGQTFETKYIYRNNLAYTIPSTMIGNYKGALNEGDTTYKFNGNNILNIAITSSKITINNVDIKIVKFEEGSYSFIYNDILYTLSSNYIDEVVNELSFEDEENELICNEIYRIGRSVSIPSQYVGTYKGTLLDEDVKLNGSSSLTVVITSNSVKVNNLSADLISYEEDTLEFLINGILFTVTFYVDEDEGIIELDLSDSYNIYYCDSLTK